MSFEQQPGTVVEMISTKNFLPLARLKTHPIRNLAHATLKTANMGYGAFAASRFARRTADESARFFSRIRGDAARPWLVCLTRALNCTPIVNYANLLLFGETSQPFRCLKLISRHRVFLVTLSSGLSISNQEFGTDEHITDVARLS